MANIKLEQEVTLKQEAWKKYNLDYKNQVGQSPRTYYIDKYEDFMKRANDDLAPHYRSLKIEPIEYIQANKFPWTEGEIIKYISRWREKGGVTDLRKARDLIDRLVVAQTPIPLPQQDYRELYKQWSEAPKWSENPERYNTPVWTDKTT